MHSIKEQNEAGLIMGVCMFLTLMLIIVAGIVNPQNTEAKANKENSIKQYYVTYK